MHGDTAKSGPENTQNCSFWTRIYRAPGASGWTIYRHATPLNVHAASTTSYTVLRTENGYDKAGNLKYVNHYLDALKSDASMVRRVTTAIEDRRTIDLADGDEIRTNELTGRKSTYVKRFSLLATSRDAASSCVASGNSKGTVDGTETIAGHPTVRQVSPSQSGNMTAWYALDAQCALLQLRLEHEDGVTVQSLAKLTVGEPASTLFDVQSTFREVPPSELIMPVCSDSGKCSSVPESVKQRLDARYYVIQPSMN